MSNLYTQNIAFNLLKIFLSALETFPLPVSLLLHLHDQVVSLSLSVSFINKYKSATPLNLYVN